MSPTVTGLEVIDVRFPTSEELDGSDAMNPDPDYSAACVVLRPDAPGAAAIRSLRPYVQGRTVSSVTGDPGSLYRELTHDSQLRRLGPEKGVMHMAAGAVVNATWDLAAKEAGKPGRLPLPDGRADQRPGRRERRWPWTAGCRG
jgi:L-fuconate dehydratase